MTSKNCFPGSKVTAILLNGWILPIGGASWVKGLPLQPAGLFNYPNPKKPSI